MGQTPREEADTNAKLDEWVAAHRHDPLAFVEDGFPWGEPGTELEKASLENWQRDELSSIRDGLKTPSEAIQNAVASGHGIGKSALVSWIILWSISTFPDTRGVVTANTDTQLRTKTWPELGKWHRLFIASHYFTYTATAIYSVDPSHEKTWRFDAIPWSKTSPESFAGLHNHGKRVVLIFDEASAIPDAIWEVGDGAFTDKDTELIWLAFGNPTRNTGRFFDCFHKHRHRWKNRQVDSRSVGITNKDKLKKWEEDYGEDSDYFRVRCRGVFPKVGDRQFIGHDIVEEARGRIIHESTHMFMPKIVTLDSAWDGGDEIVCGFRQGNASKILWVQSKNDDDVALARRLATTEDEVVADAVFIDKGYGTGVYSVGKHMGRTWTLIAFGGEATRKDRYLNKRAEMWGDYKDWLCHGGCLPDDPKLCEETTAPEQIFREDGKVQLESKKDIKERLGFSPGRADALVLTFALPVKAKEQSDKLFPMAKRQEFARPKEYDPFSDA